MRRRRVLQDMNRFLLILSTLALMLEAPSYAAPAAPSMKPEKALHSNVVAQDDFKLLIDALEAADAGQWSTTRQIRNRLKDNDARRILLWRMATNAAARSEFAELDEALNDLSDWPKRDIIQKQAEYAIDESSLSHSAKLRWFERNPPITGQGKLQLALSLDATNQKDNLTDLVVDIWRNHSLARSSESLLLSEFGKRLSSSDHSARADMLLWTGQRSSASKLKRYLSRADTALMNARVALMEGRRGVDNIIADVPSSHASDPGLLYERAKWRRKRTRNFEGSLELLKIIDASQAPPAGRRKIWDERSIALRTLIRDDRWEEAYALTAPHHLESGVDFAEAEFFAGWIALRYLNKKEAALSHFTSLADNVGSPISLSRGLFWKGEALNSLDRSEEAAQAYQAAAEHSFTYYGQLAAERLQNLNGVTATLVFATPTDPSPEESAQFHDKSVVRAAKLLAETGRLSSFERFSFHIDDLLTTVQEHQMLSDLAIFYLKPRAGIRGGKAGLAKGVVAPAAAFPIVAIPDSPDSGIAEPALILALSRQESELTPNAISHANAHGMMQLLPATGRNTARKTGLPYRTSWLTDDPEYNFRLGRGYLDELIERFNGSYVLALSAYNAGPSRAYRWVEEYGDPRTGEIDPIDFVESIPFSETRNYVQRILENTQVYRHRLTGDPTNIRLVEDLHRGG